MKRERIIKKRLNNQSFNPGSSAIGIFENCDEKGLKLYPLLSDI